MSSTSAVEMSDPAATIDQGLKTLIINGRSNLNGTGRSYNNKINDVSYFTLLISFAASNDGY